mgnify:CR=1 FL=1
MAKLGCRPGSCPGCFSSLASSFSGMEGIDSIVRQLSASAMGCLSTAVPPGM